jgi:hypothetical protein
MNEKAKIWKDKNGLLAECVGISIDGFGYTAYRLYGSDKGYLDVVIDVKGNEVTRNSELWNKCVNRIVKNKGGAV